MKKILHITSWFPSQSQPTAVPFISEHIESLSSYAEQDTWHIEVQESNHIFKVESSRRRTGQSAIILHSRITSWQIKEILTFLLLLSLRIRLLAKNAEWDLTIFHIAYPLLRFPRLIRFLFGNRVLLIEHWSAYHYNFYLPKESKSLQRMRNVFSANIPIVAVSHTLPNDIKSFAGKSHLPIHVIPNAVDTDLFHPSRTSKKESRNSFLMVASWAHIKRPFLIFDSFRVLLHHHPELKLTVIGGGKQFLAMQRYVDDHDLARAIVLLGPRNKSYIARQMQECDALLHASGYETFSVVCAEALCCGLPVLASNVGALTELINSKNGLLVDNTVNSWISALRYFINEDTTWNHKAIAESAISLYSRQRVGRLLADLSDRVIAG